MPLYQFPDQVGLVSQIGMVLGGGGMIGGAVEGAQNTVDRGSIPADSSPSPSSLPLPPGPGPTPPNQSLGQAGTVDLANVVSEGIEVAGGGAVGRAQDAQNAAEKTAAPADSPSSPLPPPPGPGPTPPSQSLGQADIVDLVKMVPEGVEVAGREAAGRAQDAQNAAEKTAAPADSPSSPLPPPQAPESEPPSQPPDQPPGQTHKTYKFLEESEGVGGVRKVADSQAAPPHPPPPSEAAGTS